MLLDRFMGCKQFKRKSVGPLFRSENGTVPDPPLGRARQQVYLGAEWHVRKSGIDALR
jgi:hypothetical protein